MGASVVSNGVREELLRRPWSLGGSGQEGRTWASKARARIVRLLPVDIPRRPWTSSTCPFSPAMGSL